MWISEAAALAAASGGVRPVMLLRIAGNPIARAWSGVGNLQIPVDVVETDADALYRGVGALLDWPQMEVLLNGEAGRLTFGMSGVDAVVQALFEDDLTDLEGAAVNVGVAFLDEDWQLVAPPLWIIEGEVEDGVTDQSRSGDTMVRGIELNVIYGSKDRRRPLLANWSPQDQELRSPGDKFCERTPLYNEGVTVSWPRFGSSG